MTREATPDLGGLARYWRRATGRPSKGRSIRTLRAYWRAHVPFTVRVSLVSHPVALDTEERRAYVRQDGFLWTAALDVERVTLVPLVEAWVELQLDRIRGGLTHDAYERLRWLEERMSPEQRREANARLDVHLGLSIRL